MNNYISKLAQVAIAITIIFSACKREKKETVTTEDYKGVFIINEGGFGKSDGSVGLYKPGSGDYFDAFLKANGRKLGDVIQSMTLINGKFYIVVNNSNKIEVVNQGDFKSVTTIVVSQPRNILKISDTKAYITRMFTNEMSVLDLTNNSISKTIDTKASTDNMALMGDKVYAGKAYSDLVYVISTSSDAVIDSVKVGSGLGSIVNISADKIGLFCLGMLDFTSGSIIENGEIAIINKDSNKVERTIPLTTASIGGTMISSSGSLYYTFGDSKLYAIPANATSGAALPLITIAGGIYGVNIDPLNGNVYILDAGNFSAEGKVYIYNSSAVLQKEITAGIAPSKVFFNY